MEVQLFQDTTVHKSIVTRPWVFSFSYALSMPGPARDIEKAMVESGFNQTTTGGIFYTGHTHPHSSAVGISFVIAVNKEIIPHLLLGMSICGTGTTSTEGEHSPVFSLKTTSNVLTFSPTVSTYAGKRFRAGIGPAFHYIRTSSFYNYLPHGNKSESKLGFLTFAGIFFPFHPHLNIALDFQYRYAGKLETGPFEMTEGLNKATFPKTTVSDNYYCIALGLSYRL